MHRRQLVLLMLLAFTAATSAQTRGVVTPTSVFVPALAETVTASAPHATPDQVVARLMSFDRNGDGKLERDELLERMENLVTRADASGDGALDEVEIRSLAVQPQVPVVVRGFQAGHYSFGDESGLSSRFHIEGALDDLRLDSSTREQALVVVKAYVDNLERTAAANLLKEMEDLLTAEQLAKFKVALDRQGQARTMTFVNGPNRAPIRGASQVVFVLMDLSRTIDQYALPPPQKAQALAAIERFKNRMRPGDAERFVLLEQMQDILSEEERDNFRAALERRPVVKAGGMMGFVNAQGIVGGIQGGVVGGVQGGLVGGPPQGEVVKAVIVR